MRRCRAPPRTLPMLSGAFVRPALFLSYTKADAKKCKGLSPLRSVKRNIMARPVDENDGVRLIIARQGESPSVAPRHKERVNGKRKTVDDLYHTLTMQDEAIVARFGEGHIVEIRCAHDWLQILHHVNAMNAARQRNVLWIVIIGAGADGDKGRDENNHGNSEEPKATPH